MGVTVHFKNSVHSPELGEKKFSELQKVESSFVFEYFYGCFETYYTGDDPKVGTKVKCCIVSVTRGRSMSFRSSRKDGFEKKGPSTDIYLHRREERME